MASRPRLLVVDDDLELARLVADIARDSGYEVEVSASSTTVLSTLGEREFDLVITDVRMPDIDGIDLIAHVKSFDPRIAVIAMTAFGSIEMAVRAMRAGAFDYIPKPFQPKDMALRMDRAVEQRAMSLELSRLRSEVAERFSVAGILGRSETIQRIATLVRRVADNPGTVLVTGPSGSGKEVVARALHGESRRRSQNFVAVNCAAIPAALLEAELFGVKRGAYTDARADRRGMFQEADGGTLFLDEIGDLAPALQAKLLRVLQEREVRPVGGNAVETIDVRVVAATNRDLRAAVTGGEFREDLFYRLAVIEIAMPPLRERADDIVPLAEHFLARAAARASKPIVGFSGAAIKAMLAAAWPGNVRELENAVERAVALCEEDRIGLSDLPDSIKARRPPDFLDAAAERMMSLEEVDRAYAQLVLKRVGGNKARAAALLGVDRRTLQRWFGERGNGERQ